MTERQPLPIGRRPRKPTPKDIAFIEKSIGEGCDLIEVVRGLKTSTRVLTRWRAEFPAVEEAFAFGRSVEHKALRSKLFEKAMKGDTVALLFLLKCRHGYREGDQSERGNGATITINLPGAMPLAKFLTVDNESSPRAQRLPDAPAAAARRG